MLTSGLRQFVLPVSQMVILALIALARSLAHLAQRVRPIGYAIHEAWRALRRFCGVQFDTVLRSHWFAELSRAYRRGALRLGQAVSWATGAVVQPCWFCLAHAQAMWFSPRLRRLCSSFFAFYHCVRTWCGARVEALDVGCSAVVALIGEWLMRWVLAPAASFVTLIFLVCYRRISRIGRRGGTVAACTVDVTHPTLGALISLPALAASSEMPSATAERGNKKSRCPRALELWSWCRKKSSSRTDMRRHGSFVAPYSADKKHQRVTDCSPLQPGTVPGIELDEWWREACISIRNDTLGHVNCYVHLNRWPFPLGVYRLHPLQRSTVLGEDLVAAQQRQRTQGIAFRTDQTVNLRERFPPQVCVRFVPVHWMEPPATTLESAPDAEAMTGEIAVAKGSSARRLEEKETVPPPRDGSSRGELPEWYKVLCSSLSPVPQDVSYTNSPSPNNHDNGCDTSTVGQAETPPASPAVANASSESAVATAELPERRRVKHDSAYQMHEETELAVFVRVMIQQK